MRLFSLVLLLWLTTAILPAELVLVEEREIGPGSTYRAYVDEALPLRVFVTEVPLGDPAIGFRAVAGRDNLYERERTSSVAARYTTPDHIVIAAINNDFGGPRSTPWGMYVDQGVLHVTPINRSSLSINKDGNAHIGLFTTSMRLEPLGGNNCPPLAIDHLNRWHRFNQGALYTSGWGRSEIREEEVLEVILAPENREIPPTGSVAVAIEHVARNKGGTPISDDIWILHLPANLEVGCLAPGTEWRLVTETTPNFGAWETVAGGVPRLVSEGRVAVSQTETYNKEAFSTNRHPRTAVGISEDRNKLLLVVIDGRQGGVSAGASLEETAEIMVWLGAHEALNMDGGGSSTMVVRGEVMNTPSDGEEREVTSSLLVISRLGQGDPAYLDLTAPAHRVAPGLPVPIARHVFDAARNELASDAVELVWTLPEGAEMRGERIAFSPSLDIQTVFVRSERLDFIDSIDFVAPPVAELRITTDPLQPRPGVPFTLLLEARDTDGETLWLDSSALAFEALGEEEHEGLERLGGNRFVAEEAGVFLFGVGYAGLDASSEVNVREPRRIALASSGDAPWSVQYLAVDEEHTSSIEVGEDGMRVEYRFIPGETSAVYFDTRREFPPEAESLMIPVEVTSTHGIVRALLANEAGELFLLNLRPPGWQDDGMYSGELSALVAHWENPEAIATPPFTLRQIYLVEPRLNSTGVPTDGAMAVGTPIVEGFFAD